MSPSSSGSRLFPFLLGLVLAGVGGFFCVWMFTAYARVRTTYAWPEVPCLVTRAQVIEFKPVPNVAPRYRLDVDYFFTWEGRTVHSQRVRSRVRTTTDRRRAEEWLAKFPAGSERPCYVNPAAPEEAVLERDSRAMIYTLWFPGLFLGGGLIMAWRALRRR